LTAVGSLLFFAATDNSNDRELWISDGTTIGTRRVKDINPTGSSSPSDFANVAGSLFFAATGPGGRELWKSDGTVLGTIRVKDLRKGPNGSVPEGTTAVGDLAFFSAFDRETQKRLIWRSDGTAAGTYPLHGADPYADPQTRPYENRIVRVGDRLYFTATDDLGGCSLQTGFYRTDGTEAGTFRVTDDITETEPILSFKDRFYYAEGNALRRANLSETDGVLVKAFGSAFNDNLIIDITKVGSRLFVMVDIRPYENGEFNSTDRQLWKSDGTTAGTKLVRSWGHAVGGDPLMTNVGGELFFVSTDTDGSSDVWRSNGTLAGTMPVADIGDSYPYALSAVGASLYFDHDDGVHGREPWRIVP
jgi:ELWxxDGT repeat protein